MSDKQLISVGPSPYKTPQRIAAPSTTPSMLAYIGTDWDWVATNTMELLVSNAISSNTPPSTLYNEDGDDWLYADP